MKRKFRAKVSGVFDIVQLSDATFSEVCEKLKESGYQIDQQFTDRNDCHIEAAVDNDMRNVNRGDMVFTDECGNLFIMSEKRFNSTYDEDKEDSEIDNSEVE